MITVAWLRYDKDGETCCRCVNSSRIIHKTVKIMRPALRNMKIDLVLKEVMLADDQLGLSNTIMINGKNILQILGEKESDKATCLSCSELNGSGVRHRTCVRNGCTLDSLTQEKLQEAIVAEIGVLRPSMTVQDEEKKSCSCKT